MQSIIRFTGRISWDGQMNGLPSQIYSYIILDGDNTEEINKVIEAQATAFVRSQVMVTQREQGKIIDVRQTPSDRKLVPMRWIVEIYAEVIPLTGELSFSDDEGVERLKDGSEPIKN
jgi:hypothetical protein